MNVQENYKFVIALYKGLDSSIALNATAHMALGLCAKAVPELQKAMSFISFTDNAGYEHPSISGQSLIVLRATQAEIRKLVNAAREQDILYTDFLQTMTGGTWVEQLEKTKNTPETELLYYGVALWGEKETITALTKKLSLWRS